MLKEYCVPPSITRVIPGGLSPILTAPLSKHGQGRHHAGSAGVSMGDLDSLSISFAYMCGRSTVLRVL